jgi:hypothetical protein
MGQPINVSAAEFERLRQMAQGNEKRTGAEVAGKALDLGKKIGKGYLVVVAVGVLVWAAIFGPIMLQARARLLDTQWIRQDGSRVISREAWININREVNFLNDMVNSQRDKLQAQAAEIKALQHRHH